MRAAFLFAILYGFPYAVLSSCAGYFQYPARFTVFPHKAYICIRILPRI